MTEIYTFQCFHLNRVNTKSVMGSSITDSSQRQVYYIADCFHKSTRICRWPRFKSMAFQITTTCFHKRRQHRALRSILSYKLFESLSVAQFVLPHRSFDVQYPILNCIPSLICMLVIAPSSILLKASTMYKKTTKVYHCANDLSFEYVCTAISVDLPLVYVFWALDRSFSYRVQCIYRSMSSFILLNKNEKRIIGL